MAYLIRADKDNVYELEFDKRLFITPYRAGQAEGSYIKLQQS